MAFLWLADKPLRTREEIAREVHQVSLRRGLDELATVIALMTISVEVGANDKHGQRQWWCPWNANDPSSRNYPHDSQSNDGRSVGYFQQQNGRAGEVVSGSDNWWGSMQSRMTLASAANVFLDRLADDYGRAANNPRLAGEFAQRVQRSAFPDRYAEKWGEAWDVLRRALGANPPVPEPPPVDRGPWTGDPVWLADVLRAEGLNVVEFPGWRNRGHGDFKDIRGVMVHHTGSDGATAASIAHGRTDLPGPLSQIHIARDGTVTVVAVGVAWHAGAGEWPWLPKNNGNWHLIGIEAANSGGPGPNAPLIHRSVWPDAQYDAMVKCCAAINRRLAQNSDRTISHKEYAGRAQGKWDPGQIDMNIFRADVQRQIDSRGGDELTPEQDRLLREVHACLFNRVPSQSLYRNPGETGRWQLHELIKNMDGMAHEERVEQLARQGDADSIARIVRVARGEGAVTEEWAIERAKKALMTIPNDILKAWQEGQ